MTAPTILPTRVPAPSRPTWRAGIAAARRALHPHDQDLAGVDRHADQMAAIGRAVRP